MSDDARLQERLRLFFVDRSSTREPYMRNSVMGVESVTHAAVLMLAVLRGADADGAATAALWLWLAKAMFGGNLERAFSPEAVIAATGDEMHKRHSSGSGSGVCDLLANAVVAARDAAVPFPWLVARESQTRAWLETTLGASISVCDSASQACDAGNAFIALQTRGHLHDVLKGPLSPEAVVLINAAYFAGTWQRAFGAAGKQLFHCSDGAPVPCDMMMQTVAKRTRGVRGTTAVSYVDGKGANINAACVPYVASGDAEAKDGSEYAMCIICPEERRARPEDGNDMDMVVQGVATLMARQHDGVVNPYEVYLPKFDVKDAAHDLTPVFRAMDMDVSRSGVSAILHAATCAVDEKGTVATAATAVVMMRCVAALPPQVRFDRPFYYIVCRMERDATHPTPMFVGFVADPTV